MSFLDRKLKRKFFEKVFREINESAAVLVEGKRDAEALKAVGVTARVIQANGKPEGVIAKATEGKGRVLLLFDFDEEGERKERFFDELLQEKGVRSDSLLRKRFRKLFRVNCVEELPFWFAKTLEEIR